jgi:hypothetical protein
VLSIIVFTFLYLPASAAHLTARRLVYHLLFWDCLPLGKVLRTLRRARLGYKGLLSTSLHDKQNKKTTIDSNLFHDRLMNTPHHATLLTNEFFAKW